MDAPGTFDFAWEGRTNSELLFVTNECLVLFQGGKDLPPTISQVRDSLLSLSIQALKFIFTLFLEICSFHCWIAICNNSALLEGREA
jgi:hypothetical protein